MLAKTTKKKIENKKLKNDSPVLDLNNSEIKSLIKKGKLNIGMTQYQLARVFSGKNDDHGPYSKNCRREYYPNSKLYFYWYVRKVKTQYWHITMIHQSLHITS